MKAVSNHLHFDLKRRQQFKRSELDYLLKKSIVLNEKFSTDFRFLIQFSKQLKSTRIRNRCRLTGKSRTVFKLMGLSRMPFRFYMAQRLLSGFKHLNI